MNVKQKLENRLNTLRENRLNTLRLKDQSGFTIVEILIAVSLLVVVSAIVIFAVSSSQSVNENVAGTTMSQSEVLNTTNALTRDISAADRIIQAGSNYIQFATTTNGEETIVTYFTSRDSTSLTTGVPSTMKSFIQKTIEAKQFGVFEIRKVGSEPPTVADIDSRKAVLPGGTIQFKYFDVTGATIVGGFGTEPNPINTSNVSSTNIGKISRVEFQMNTTGGDTSISLASSASPRLGSAAGTPGAGVSNESSGLPPSAPTLTALLPARTDVTQLSWTAIEGASGYTLYRQNRTQPGLEVVGVYPGNVNTATDPGRVWGETYVYHITASGYFGISGKSNDASVVAVPRGAITGSAVDLSNNITWQEFNGVGTKATPENSTATYYQLYRKAPGQTDASATKIYEGLANSFSDTNVTYGNTWVYYIIPVNQGGIGFKTNEVTLVSPPTAPVLSGTHTRGFRNLTWTAPTNVGNGVATTSNVYDIRRTDPNATTWGTRAATRSYKDGQNIETNPNFSYQVRARNAAGWGPWSNTVTLTPRPLAPTLSGTHSNGVRNLSWTAATNAGQTNEAYTGGAGTTENVYQVERTTPSGTTFNTISTVLTLADDSTIDSASFTYRARAWNITGWGPWSNSITLNPRPDTPGVTVWDYGNSPSTRDGTNHATWNIPANTTNIKYSKNHGAETDGGTSTGFVDNVDWASTNIYHARACNITGCSGWGQDTGEQAPGPFSVTQVWQQKSYGINTDWNWGWTDGVDGQAFTGWNVGRVDTVWSWANGAQRYDYAYTRVGDGYIYSNIGNTNVYRGSTAEPTGAYDINIRAVAANGLSRDAGTFKFYAAPAMTRQVDIGFLTTDGNDSGTWVRGDYNPVRGLADNRQIRAHNVARNEYTGGFYVNYGTGTSWTNHSGAEYWFGGGINKSQASPSNRVGSQIWTRTQKNLPWDRTGGTHISAAPYAMTDSGVWSGTTGADSSVLATIRWSTNKNTRWQYNTDGSWTQYRNTPGYQQVRWTEPNFPRGGQGAWGNANQSNWWRVNGQ